MRKQLPLALVLAMVLLSGCTLMSWPAKWETAKYGSFKDGFYYSGDGSFRMPTGGLLPPFRVEAQELDFLTKTTGVVVMADDFGRLYRVEWFPYEAPPPPHSGPFADKAKRDAMKQDTLSTIGENGPTPILVKEFYDPAWDGRRMVLVFFVKNGSHIREYGGDSLDAYRGMMIGVKDGLSFNIMLQEAPLSEGRITHEEYVQRAIDSLNNLYDGIELL